MKLSAEAALRQSELRHRSLIEATSAVTWSCPPSGLHVVSQPQWMAFTGQTADEMLGAGWADVIHPDDRAGIAGEWERCVRTGEEFKVMQRLRRHDGEWRWMSVTAVPLRDEDGTIQEWFGMHIDITERKGVELALRGSESRFRLALKNSPITVFEQDLDLRYTWIYNPKAGFDAQSVLGKTDAELMDASAALLLTAIKREVLETGQPARREVSVAAPAQAVSHFELTVEPRHGPDGKINGTVCSSVDISERRREQDALQLTKQRLDEVIDGAGLGTWEWNLETGHLLINARWAEMLGYSVDELAPLSIEKCAGLRHPDDLLEANKRAEPHIAGDTPYFEVEARMRHKNGSWVWVRDRGRVVTRGGDGLPILMTGTHLDITSSKNAAQQLLELTDRLEDAVEVAGLRLWEIELATGELSWEWGTGNRLKRAAPRDSVSAVEAMGAIHAEDRAAFEAAVRAAIYEREPLTSRVRLVAESGAVSHMEYRAHLSKDSQRLLGVGRDITADVAANEELIAKRRDAESASVAKGEFLAKMSHEIRTPMNGIIGMLEVMGRVDLVPEAREHAETALSSAQDLMHILDDVIDVSQLEAHQVAINPKVFEIGALINSAIALFGSRARQKGILLSVSVAPVVPTWVLGDRRRIRQVLNNLIGNAVKFTDRGAVSVAASYEADRGILRIAVSDTGIGMSEDVSVKAFDLFYQADETATRRVGGSGLGLAICKQLVELMGGEISISSKPGCGSEFSVTLCLASAAEPERSATALATEIATRPLQVLVVEDNDANQRILLAILSSVGHAVTIADNGADAVGLAASQYFDLILMDIMMPVMDGVTAARQIRELGGRAGGIPIIALTANALAGDRNRYLAAGMTDYLAKPIDVRALLEAVARASPEAEQLD